MHVTICVGACSLYEVALISDFEVNIYRSTLQTLSLIFKAKTHLPKLTYKIVPNLIGDNEGKRKKWC